LAAPGSQSRAGHHASPDASRFSTNGDPSSRAYGASCWSAAPSEPLPSWPGLTRPSTSRRVRRAPVAPRTVQGLQGQNVLTSPLPCGRSLRRNTWMAGSSPAMTLQVRFAPPSIRTSLVADNYEIAFSCEKTESVLCICLRRSERRRPEASRSRWRRRMR
jgi:hypothetical protein